MSKLVSLKSWAIQNSGIRFIDDAERRLLNALEDTCTEHTTTCVHEVKHGSI